MKGPFLKGGLRVGFRALGLGFGVQGLGFRVHERYFLVPYPRRTTS